jgi:hypothetical protein
MLDPIKDLSSIGSWFLLKWGTKMIMFLNVFNINEELYLTLAGDRTLYNLQHDDEGKIRT